MNFFKKSWIVFFSASILWAGFLNAQCRMPLYNTCRKVMQVSASYSFIDSLKNLKPICRVEFEDIESKQRWSGKFFLCPHFKEPVYAHKTLPCNDTVFAFSSEDKLHVLSEDECKPILDSRKKMFDYYQTIPKGITVEKLKDYGLTTNGDELSTLWQFGASPEFMVIIQVTGEQCNGKLCQDQSVQKFDKIVEIYDATFFNPELYWRGSRSRNLKFLPGHPAYEFIKK